MPLTDVHRAFDTVNHKILLWKLKSIGFDSMTVAWFESYLNGRKQFVKIHGNRSNLKLVECGVPQGQ